MEPLMRASVLSAGKKSTPSDSDALGGSKESIAVTGTFMLLTDVTAAMAACLPLLPAAGPDQMWLLYAADLVRRGTKLYGPQLFESNPPLIAWISVTPLRSESGSIRYRYRQTAGLRRGEQLSPSVASGCCEAWVRSRLVLDERCQDPPSTARCSMTDTTTARPVPARSAFSR